MKDIINKIASESLPVREKINAISHNTELYKYKKDILHNKVTIELVNRLKYIIKNENLTIKGRIGAGNLADVPWIGLHDDRINSNAKEGIYVALLFKVDGSGVVISIQHGTDNYKLDEVKRNIDEIKEEFNNLNIYKFTKGKLDIRGSFNKVLNSNSRPAKYEAANILGKEYDIDNLDNIENDILKLVKIYENYVEKSIYGNDYVIESDIDYLSVNDDEELYKTINNYENEEEFYQNNYININLENINSIPSKIDISESIKQQKFKPRSIIEASIALKKANFKCEVDENHKTFVNSNGIIYMEKHHLIPMKYYYNYEDTSIDHHINIYSLCPLCHRKIHYGNKEEKDNLIKLLFEQRKDKLKKYYNIDIENLLKLY